MSRKTELTEAGKAALAECVKYYCEIGNTEEHSHTFLDHLDEEWLLHLYDLIQERRKIGDVATTISLLGD